MLGKAGGVDQTARPLVGREAAGVAGGGDEVVLDDENVTVVRLYGQVRAVRECRKRDGR